MADRPRLLVIIGSGELGPSMARVQRDVVRRLRSAEPRAGGVRGPRAAVIDTPYAFQENATATTAELLDFHGRRLGLPTAIATLRADGDAEASERALVSLRDADYVFSGPGSPSYALRHWSGSALPQLLEEKLAHGGAVVFASAAALTLGRATLPVYEIYKSGEDPRWLAGLDVLASIGVSAAVVPHYDNADGTGHDTRYCFIGERRLRVLEGSLPQGTIILGVDEHTALVIDVAEDSARVEGRGGVTLRHAGDSQVFASGARLSLDQLRAAAGGPADGAPVAGGRRAAAGVDGRHSEGMVDRLLDARREADSMTQRASLVKPLVDALLSVRAEARARGDWQTADGIRRRLVELGIDVTDAPDGSSSARQGGLSRSS